MSARICVKCGNKLTVNNNYFCSYCGEVLIPSLVKKPCVSNVNIVNFEFLGNKKSLKILYSIVTSKYFTFLIFVFALFCVFILFFKPQPSSNIHPILEQKPEVSTCTGEFSCGDFGSDNITEVIPEDVSFYVEGFDFNKFSQFILDYDYSYNVLIKELTYLESKHLSVFIENIDGKYYWTFVLVSSKEPSANLIGLINNPQNIYVGRLSNFYVVSSRRDILGDMQRAKEGLSKNLKQNNIYTIAINKTKNGQLMLLSLKDEGNTIINKILGEENVPSYIKNILSKINLEKDDYLII